MKARRIVHTAVLVFLSIGCTRTEKDISGLPARTSPAWFRGAVLYEVSVPHATRERTFAGLEQRLDEIRSLGVTSLVLLPIHPIGLLNRKGEHGSPFAVHDYYEVNPAYGTREEFKHFVQTAHQHDVRVILDMPIAAAAWDSKLILDHPDWFRQNEEGAIVSPDVDSYDVAALNYRHHELRKYMIEMLKFWVREFDIDGFRSVRTSDVPLEFWELARREVERLKPIVMIADTAIPQLHLAAFDATPAIEFTNALRSVVKDASDLSVLRRALDDEQRRYPRGALRVRTVGCMRNDSLFSWHPQVPSGALPAVVAMNSLLPGIVMVTGGIESASPACFSLTEQPNSALSVDRSRLEILRSILHLRLINEAPAETRIETPDATASGRICSIVVTDSQRMLVALFNLSNSPQDVRLNLPVRLLRSYDSADPAHRLGKSIILQPYEYKLFVSDRPTEVP